MNIPKMPKSEAQGRNRLTKTIDRAMSPLPIRLKNAILEQLQPLNPWTRPIQAVFASIVVCLSLGFLLPSDKGSAQEDLEDICIAVRCNSSDRIGRPDFTRYYKEAITGKIASETFTWDAKAGVLTEEIHGPTTQKAIQREFGQLGYNSLARVYNKEVIHHCLP